MEQKPENKKIFNIDTKDIIGLSISLVSLVASISIAYYTNVRIIEENTRTSEHRASIVELNKKAQERTENAKKAESERTENAKQQELRRTLTDITVRLGMLYKEDTSDNGFSSSQKNSMVMVMLAKQASIIVEQIPKLANELDYLAIGASFFSGMDIKNGTKYYEKAIKTTNSSYYRGVVQRSFAVALALPGYFKEARIQFSAAIDSFAIDDDHNRFYMSQVIASWAMMEKNLGNIAKAGDLINRAKVAIQSISNNEKRRMSSILINQLGENILNTDNKQSNNSAWSEPNQNANPWQEQSWGPVQGR